MSRPQKVALQRCFLFGNAPRGVEDAAPYKRKMRFFDTLSIPGSLREPGMRSFLGRFLLFRHPDLFGGQVDATGFQRPVEGSGIFVQDAGDA